MKKWWLILCGLSLAQLTPAATMTSLTMTSQPGDYVGQGQQYSFTMADGVWRLGTYGPNNCLVQFHNANYTQTWTLIIGAPIGSKLAVGTYDGAVRLATATQPGLDVSGDGRGCNTATGSFIVKAVTYDLTGYPTALWVDFIEHCEGAPPTLSGELIYNVELAVPTRNTGWGQLKTIYR